MSAGIATGWKVRGSNASGEDIILTCSDRPWDQLSILHNGYWVIPGCKEVVSWRWSSTPSNAEVQERVLLLWSFVACSKVNFTFTFSAAKNNIAIWYKKAAVLAVGLLELWIIDSERNGLICFYTFPYVVHFCLLLICKLNLEANLKCRNEDALRHIKQTNI
jgi:hypothetical protein